LFDEFFVCLGPDQPVDYSFRDICELTVSESIYKEIKNEVELIEEIPEWSFDLNGKILI
jgi:hypothetical protein